MKPKTIQAKTISSMIADLKKAKKQYGDLQLIYSSDDEGNSFHPVWETMGVTAVKIDEIESYMDGDSIEFESKKPNAIILN